MSAKRGEMEFRCRR